MVHVASMTVIRKSDGQAVPPGAVLTGLRGEQWELVKGTDPTTPGKAGHVEVRRNGETRWFYASGFDLQVVGIMSCGCPVGPNDGGHLDACTEE